MAGSGAEGRGEDLNPLRAIVPCVTASCKYLEQLFCKSLFLRVLRSKRCHDQPASLGNASPPARQPASPPIRSTGGLAGWRAGVA